MSKFVNELEAYYTEHASAENAVAMEKYMKNLFPFYGIKTVLRRALLKEAVEYNTTEVKVNTRKIALELYNKPEREYHYSAIEILTKELKKKYVIEDIGLIEDLLVTNSWWDSVDSISKNILGAYLQQYPAETEKVVERFSGSGNMWLNRAAILFQLGYKQNTNQKLLFSECDKHKESTEFFIQKAIGWALREYAKTNTEAVRAFVSTAGLKPLSTREALKNI